MFSQFKEWDRNLDNNHINAQYGQQQSKKQIACLKKPKSYHVLPIEYFNSKSVRKTITRFFKLKKSKRSTLNGIEKIANSSEEPGEAEILNSKQLTDYSGSLFSLSQIKKYDKSKKHCSFKNSFRNRFSTITSNSNTSYKKKLSFILHTSYYFVIHRPYIVLVNKYTYTIYIL